MADTSTQTDKHNISKQGDKVQAVVTRYFDDMDKAVQWAESTYTKDLGDEPAASDMTAEDAEAINSNVNPAPIPAGAEQVMSGGGANNDTNVTSGAPAPDEAAGELAVDNTAAGTFDPQGDNSQQQPISTPVQPTDQTKPSNKN